MYGTNPPYFEFNAGESGANPPDDLARSHSFCSECAQHNAPLLHGILSVFLMFGREQIVPLDVAMGNPRSDQGEVSQYAKILLEKMHQAHALVRERLFLHGERMKRAYDRKVHEKSFSPGQRVWVLNLRAYKGRCPKWERRYQGPYLVLEKINDVKYRVQKQPGQQTAVVHLD